MRRVKWGDLLALLILVVYLLYRGEWKVVAVAFLVGLIVNVVTASLETETK